MAELDSETLQNYKNDTENDLNRRRVTSFMIK